MVSCGTARQVWRALYQLLRSHEGGDTDKWEKQEVGSGGEASAGLLVLLRDRNSGKLTRNIT